MDDKNNGANGNGQVAAINYNSETLKTLFTSLGLPNDMLQKANNLWITLNLKEITITNAELATCVAYSVLIDTRMPYGPLDPQLQCGNLSAPQVTITTLLKMVEMNIRKFFSCMNSLKELSALSQTVHQHLLLLERKFCFMLALFHTFEKVSSILFREEYRCMAGRSAGSVPPSIANSEGIEYRKRLVWTLFLNVRNNFVSGNLELVHAFYLLLSCFEYVLRTTPSFMLNSPYDDIRVSTAQRTNQQSIEILEKLSTRFDSSLEEVCYVKRSIEPYITTLPHSEGELDLPKLLTLYTRVYKQEGDVNEMHYLGRDKYLFEEVDPNSEASNKTETLSGQETPVRAALNTVQQFKNIITNSPPKPSNILKSYFDDCSQNPEDSIESRLEQCQKIFTDRVIENSSNMQKTVIEQRYEFGVRLYYRVLESILTSERKRLQETDFSTLLNQDTFHKSLLVCSLEIVQMTYDSMSNFMVNGTDDDNFSFHWILSAFSLTAFHFFKVLESFIKAETRLTGEIVRHLQRVESKILESIAWTEDSPLFTLMRNSEMPVIETSAEAIVGTRSTPTELYLSPMKVRSILMPSPNKKIASPIKILKVFPAASGDQSTSQKPAEKPRRSNSLSLFLNKVCRLGFHRLQTLCSMLEVSKELQQKIWTCLEQCILRKADLLKNRHLDQMILCSLYAICRVVDKEIKFKTIVQVYKELPHAEQDVYKSALIEGKRHDSIIRFYNDVYMPNMKNFILQFTNRQSGGPTLSPAPKPTASQLAMSPKYHVPGRNNIFISPLKQSPFRPSLSPGGLTPNSEQLYCFGEEGSAEKLKRINETVACLKRSTMSGVGPRSLKKLKFDSEDDSQNNTSSEPEIVIIKKKMPQIIPIKTKLKLPFDNTK